MQKNYDRNTKTQKSLNYSPNQNSLNYPNFFNIFFVTAIKIISH